MKNQIVQIDWELSKSHKEDAFLYAFSENGTLLYIGQSYRAKKTVWNEINQNIRAFSYNTKLIDVWLGHINKENSSHKNNSNQLIKDIEALLIFSNQPRDNTHHKSSYKGRDNFIVKTTGCDLIKECVRCENGVLYETCE